MDWTTKDIPSQSGRLAVITGASGGLGFEVAAILANKGAEIVVAARNADKGQTAATKLGRSARYEPLDLADLTSVKDFAARLLQRAQPISLLINNAGLAAPPKRQVTRDGFELQFGTNFLGHFLLTACLMPLLQKALSPRVVTVSSLVEKSAKIDLNDLMSEHNYSPTRSYGQSKLANLLFARELQRRSDANGWGLLSVAAHPGIAVTELTKSRPGQPVLRFNTFFEMISPLIGQSAARGALPILYAATSPDAEPGGYYGPQGFMDMKGPPGPARSSKISRDPKIAAQLWLEAETLTGAKF
jgi:NAD(P)-dependent dehydrogenase (short-subunit alcohol dehydrogenase family)